MKTSEVIAFAAIALLEGCCHSSTLSNSVRSWSSKNLPHYRELVEAKYADPQTRQNAWQSMAALVCSVDVADDRKDTPACRCQQATVDAEAQCKPFLESM